MSPYRLKTPCRAPRCRKLSLGRFCPEHQATKWKDDEKKRTRDGPSVYNTAFHKNWRIQVLHRFPVCNICKAASSSVADHIKPLSQGGEYTLENGQGLCPSCHSIKTGKERK